MTSIDYSSEVGAFTTETATRLRALALRGRFEAHLTVDTDDAVAFDDACRALGVDCVLIALPEGTHRAQPMTASHHEGDLATVLDEIDALHAALQARGVRVVRAKLEAHTDNADIPPSAADAAVLNGYFEYHLKVRADVRVVLPGPRELTPRNQNDVQISDNEVQIPNEDVIAKIRALGLEVGNHMTSLDADDVARIKRSLESEPPPGHRPADVGDRRSGARGRVVHVGRLDQRLDPDRLRTAVAPHGAHVSANDRKPGQRFVTLRVYRATLAEAEAQLAALEGAIAGAGFAIAGTIREYTLADTRVELDAGWLEPPTS